MFDFWWSNNKKTLGGLPAFKCMQLMYVHHLKACWNTQQHRVRGFIMVSMSWSSCRNDCKMQLDGAAHFVWHCFTKISDSSNKVGDIVTCSFIIQSTIQFEFITNQIWLLLIFLLRNFYCFKQSIKLFLHPSTHSSIKDYNFLQLS